MKTQVNHPHDADGFEMCFEPSDPTPCELYDGEPCMPLSTILHRASLGYDIGGFVRQSESSSVDDFFTAKDRENVVGQLDLLDSIREVEQENQEHEKQGQDRQEQPVANASSDSSDDEFAKK